MLLLTVLVGVTACSEALRWEQGVQHVMNNVSQLFIRNNIRNGLKSVQQDLDRQPERALAHWRKIQQSSRMLEEVIKKSSTEPGLHTALEYISTIREPNRKQLELLLESPHFQFRLDELEELKALQENARQGTITVTVSMIALGLLLTLITVHDLSRMFHQLARSRDLHIQIQEEERQRIAQDLHDSVVQELVDLKRSYTPDKVDQLIHSLRRVCQNLNPKILDDLGLPAAIDFLMDDLRQNGLEVSSYLDQDELVHLPQEYELPLFRVVQELCTNIKRHSKASQVNVRILYNPDESPLLRGYVSDNGCGFNTRQIASGKMGLTGIQERLRQAGGKFDFESTIGKGSRFQWMIPIRKNA